MEECFSIISLWRAAARRKLAAASPLDRQSLTAGPNVASILNGEGAEESEFQRCPTFLTEKK
jgi:hypothetical protein